MKVVLYARVSTSKQAERDLSVPDQLRQLREYCKQHAYEIVSEFREEGASATDANRPKFQEMIEFVLDPETQVGAILVLTTSRFFRDAMGSQIYKRNLKKEGIRVISITQEISDNPMGTLVEGIFELLDQFESEMNGFHTLRGMKENARQGYLNGSRPPFGYRAIAVEDARGNPKKKMAVDETEAPVVKRMFDLYVNGLDGTRAGVRRIAEILNEEGKLYRGKKKWTKQRIQERLSDEVYIGQYFFNKCNGKTRTAKPRDEWILVEIEPIVDNELFKEAQRLKKKRKPTPRTPPSVVGSPMLLTGLLTCGNCGARMTLETGKNNTYRYYNCSNYLRKGKSSCQGNRVPQPDIERQILEHLAAKLFSTVRIKRIVTQVARELTKLRQQNSSKVKGPNCLIINLLERDSLPHEGNLLEMRQEEGGKTKLHGLTVEVKDEVNDEGTEGIDEGFGGTVSEGVEEG